MYSFARTWLGGAILSWVLAHFSVALPVDRLLETETLVAFEHPKPSHPIHIVLVPKANYTSIYDLPESSTAFIADLFEAVRILVDRFGLEKTGYRLVLNGGPNQEVGHLHFHLLSEGEE